LCTTPAAELLERATALCEEMAGAAERLLRERQMRLDRLVLSIPRPIEWIQRVANRLAGTVAALEKTMVSLTHRHEQRLTRVLLLLEKNNPIAPLERGFAVVRQQGKMVKRRALFDATSPFLLQFADGEAPVHPERAKGEKNR